jgi:hypothetical protein
MTSIGLGKDHQQGQGEKQKSTQPTLTQLTIGHMTLHIETDVLEFPMGELQEKVNALGHLNIVVSRMSMQKLQYLQAGLVQEIRNREERKRTRS